MQINNFILEKDKFLFFDIFYKNNKIILICPIYFEIINISELNIFANGNKLDLTIKYIEIDWQPVQILVYNFISDIIINTIVVNYNDIVNTYQLEHIKTTKKNTLCISTLFKDDYNLINVFYDYYIKQGVTNFYMYYNGYLTEDIKNKYNLPFITLIEWNFLYYNQNCNYIQHAQLGQIHHSVYRYGKDENEYIILCDLDEYLYIPNISLLKYFKENESIDMFGFRNC